MPARVSFPALLVVLASCDRGSTLPAQPAVSQAAGSLVRRADSLERAEDWRQAAEVWHALSRSEPALRDWFLIRAAAAEPDPGRRERWLNEIRPLATTPMEVMARRKEGSRLRALLRSGDTTAAVTRYFALANVRDSVVALSLRERTGAALTIAEELAFARGAQRIGDLPTARRVYGLLWDAAPERLPDLDRYRYALALSAGGSIERAMHVLTTVRGEQAGAAAYQRARLRLRQGNASAARAALVRVASDFPNDAEAAGAALYLLGDLETDAGRDAAARDLWLRMAARYPAHALAPRARFRAAVVEASAGRWDRAGQLWRDLARRESVERNASRYWLGRARFAQGHRGAADSIWRDLAATDHESYYGMLAAQRLGGLPAVTAGRRDVDPTQRMPAPGDTGTPSMADAAPAPRRLTDEAIRIALDRAALLDSLGLPGDARSERDDVLQSAWFTAGDARSAAREFTGRERASEAIRLAVRLALLDARSTGAIRSPADDRLRYPLPFRDVLTEHTTATGLPLPFVAALIRQESRFTPDARSAAGARGLMQVMPSVGRDMAGRMGISPWDDSLLYRPEINVRLGTRHLADALRRDGARHRAYALAAYNAGRSRMVRWRAKRGAAEDWELFVERIPYVETRDYVRIVLRNEAWYRELYGNAL